MRRLISAVVVLCVSTPGPLRADDAPAAPTDEARRAAIDAACEWLRGAQLEDGSWDAGRAARDDAPRRDANLRAHGHPPIRMAGETDTWAHQERLAPAITARAIEALRVAGEDPLTADSPGGRGVAWLASLQTADGGIGLSHGPEPKAFFRSPLILNHVLATHALALAVEAAPTPERREALARAVRRLLGAQDPKRGWFALDGAQPDVVTSAWAARALMAAQRAGVALDERAHDALENWMVFPQGHGAPPPEQLGLISTQEPPHELLCSPSLAFALQTEALDLLAPAPRSDLAKLQKRARGDLAASTPPACWATFVTRDVDVEAWRATLAALRPLRLKRNRADAWRAAVASLLVDHQERADEAVAGSWAPADALCGGVFGRVFFTATAILALHEARAP